jgi:hypothetical protein
LARHPARLAGVVLALAAAAPAAAWAPETRLRVADEAVRFMPSSLRLALERHREDLRRGVLEPAMDEDGPAHRPRLAGGTLDGSVGAAAKALQEAVRQPLPFREVVRRFGVLAHFVTDAGYPPLAAHPADGRRAAHFATFARSRMERFPLVFLGHDDADLEHGDFEAFARRACTESAREDVDLGRAYAAAGWPPAPSAFDDRSVPFAVASLSYSRTVNYVVRAWLEAWRLAGGDLGYTPYLKFDPPSPK